MTAKYSMTITLLGIEFDADCEFTYEETSYVEWHGETMRETHIGDIERFYPLFGASLETIIRKQVPRITLSDAILLSAIIDNLLGANPLYFVDKDELLASLGV